jgi:DNA invertase Pin-like site-specific DNA recombinase
LLSYELAGTSAGSFFCNHQNLVTFSNSKTIMETKMAYKAVIYVRTSSESQAEKSSPAEQEADCRRLAAEKGLTVVRVYRDIEKYRAKNKLVEPSGSRSDRPGLLDMLKDASKGDFDVILAWREDRLYRGMRSMLIVLDVVQKYKLNILLAKENFDPKIAPLRAWVAQMELDGMKERMNMGVKARLKLGKANTGQDRYGYVRVGEKINIVDEEAAWVRKIFEWYTQSVPLLQIREKLIAADAPQKGSSIPRRIQWARSSIQAILQSAREYAYGFKEQSRMGTTYQIPVAPIIDLATYELFVQVRAKNRTYPAHHQEHDYLLAGHLKCACNLTWRSRIATKRRNRKGEQVERKTPIGMYFCPQLHRELRASTCPKSVSAKRAEAQVWEKLSEFILNPAYLRAQAKALVEQLQADHGQLQRDLRQVREELQVLALARHEFISQARKTRMNGDDFGKQLSEYTDKEVFLKRRLAANEHDLQTHADIDLEAQVNTYLADLQAGMEALKGTQPQTPEERHKLFVWKKRIVDLLLTEANIDENREIQIKVRVDLLKVAGHEAGAKQKTWKSPEETGGLAQGLSQSNEIVAVL